ncbi:MAG: Xaa-Pro peptidase family protein [Candidatus Korarchaeota archaeon]
MINANRLIDTLGVEAVILWNISDWHRDPNFFYVTRLADGLHENSIAIISESGIKVITSKLEEGIVRRYGLDAITLNSPTELYEKLRELIGGAKRIGYVSSSLPVKYMEKLKAEIRNAEFVDVGDGFSRMRMIKDNDEINKIGRACDVISDVMKKVVDYICEGISENELSAHVVYEILKRGGKPAFEPITSFEENAADPHYFHGARKLSRNEIVLIDIGANVDLYNSDITRTISFGSWNNKKRDVFETVLNAQESAIDYIQPGISGKDVHKIASDIIEKKYPGSFIHGLGHSLGIQVHDPGALSSTSDIILEPGMVFTIEPGAYFHSRFGIRIEDDILVTKSGAKILTNVPKKLF